MAFPLNSTHTSLSTPLARLGFLGVCGLLTVTAATAQIGVTGNTGIDTSGNYAQERAWCQANTNGVALTDCLKNSGAARLERRRGTLSNNGNFEANAMMRCEPFKGEDLAACKARVLGQGDVSGSVMGGGRIQQVETVILPSGQGAVTFEQKMPYPVIIVPAAVN